MTSAKETMPTIWQASDELWAKVEAILNEKDPPKATGRKRVDARLVLDTLIHRLRSGCQWNHLPSELADDSSAHRTLQRWQKAGVFTAIWADLLKECDELGGVDWEWQAADGATSKSRFGGIRSDPTLPTVAKLA
jgi:putative transposase